MEFVKNKLKITLAMRTTLKLQKFHSCTINHISYFVQSIFGEDKVLESHPRIPLVFFYL